MARQYFNTPLADSLITPQSAVSPGLTPTFIFSIAQANKFLALPFGQSAPSPGQVFQVRAGGLYTTPASGTIILSVFHGPGTSATAGGTNIGTSNTFTPTFSVTAGYWRLEGDLIYRTISEVALTSTCWFSGHFILSGPSGGALAAVSTVISSNAAVSVDTTGGTAGGFGALNLFVTEGTTGSSWTPEWAYIQSVN